MNKKELINNTKITILFNLAFSILEIIGGFLTNSISIISSAIHDFGDSITVCLENLFNKKSKQKPNNKYSFGYSRYKLIGKFFTSILLLITSGIIIYFAINRIKNPLNINYDGMIIFSIFGILLNAYVAYKLKNDKETNHNTMIDVYGWLIVLISSILIKLFNIFIIDPIVAIIMALYILYQTYKYLNEIFNAIMEKVPFALNIDKIQNDIITNNSNIKEIDNLNIWSIDNKNIYFTGHIILNENLDYKKIIELKNNIKKYLNEQNINHITLEFINKDEIKCKTK